MSLSYLWFTDNRAESGGTLPETLLTSGSFHTAWGQWRVNRFSFNLLPRVEVCITSPACVGANYKFVYASAGIQGVSDAGVFAQSDLRVAMDKGLLHVRPDDPLPNTDDIMPYMFICDGDHALRTDLMMPYPFWNLNMSQRIYNYHRSGERKVVENAIGILANRVFRATICLEPHQPSLHVYACTTF